MSFVNLHHHSMFSSYDGFTKPKRGAKYAKELGQNALALTDHGTTAGLIEHYNACKDEGIKPILGVEGYFQPHFDKEKDRFHITLFAKNQTGYENIMKMLTEANKKNFYYKPIIDFEMLKKYSEGVICSSACAVGYISQLINGDYNNAQIKKSIKIFKKVFGDDYYLEVMPIEYKPQRIANKKLVKFGRELNVNIILTNDSHYAKPDDYETYKFYHKIKENDPDANYEKRHMVGEEQIKEYWSELHPEINPKQFIENTQKLADKCGDPEDWFDNDKVEMVPPFAENPKEKLREEAINGLKEKDKWKDEYKEQLEFELDVIEHHGFENYFLLTKDIVDYAKENNIKVGFGRGSVGGSLLAYALGIIEIDSVKLGTHFERFLRKEKKKFPDIDIDFDSNRRDEIIEYLLNKYEGRAAQIANFGLWKVRNLINDMDNVYEMDSSDKKTAKKQLEKFEDDIGSMPVSQLRDNTKLRKIDNKYDGFLKHFKLLFKQMRFVGKHAAGVAITPDEISNYAALQKVKGNFQTAYDLDSLEELGVLKMDILGLSTLTVIADVEERTNAEWNEEILEDEEAYEALSNGNTTGVFQFEKAGARDVLKQVSPDNIQELIACNALNRPAPKKLGILDAYVEGKNGNVDKDTPWYEFTKDTYGNIVYQEHVMEMCREIGGMNWDETDTVMKSLGEAEHLKPKFVEGATKHGYSKEEARKMFDKMTEYLFNKGHGAAYSLISLYCAYLKINYPLEFYLALMRNEKKDRKRRVYTAAAAQEDIVIMIPHVNGSAEYSIREVDGERVIQEGLRNIKGIGAKTAQKIEEHAPFESVEDFQERVPGRYSSDNIVEKLEEEGALEFRSKVFWRRIIKYNSFLNAREAKIRY